MDALSSFEPVRRTVKLVVAGQADSQVEISLTKHEQQILFVLMETVKKYNLGTQVRIAGGWVRDKLLNRLNEDIDVAVDNMKGAEFANHVAEYLGSVGLKTSSVGVIQANPEQSKHLETATTKVLDQWVDFANLRTEVYDPASRIPVVAIGTPTQDSERRDFTLNSLFYNLTTNAIEDLTGRGVADLRAGVIRTPLAPRVTFLDDPLRVLRGVRFASRYSFVLESDMRSHMADKDVVAALACKISRERIGIETDGMLGGSRPIAALRTLHSLGLIPVVFDVPEGSKLTGRLSLPPLLPPAAASSGSPPEPSTPSTSAAETRPHSFWAAPADPAPLMAAASDAGLLNADIPATFPEWPILAMRVVEALDYLLLILPEKTGFGALTEPVSHCLHIQPSRSVGFGCARDTSTPAEALTDNASRLGIQPENMKLLVCAALLHVFSHAQRVNAKGRSEPLPWMILAESLKQPHKIAGGVMSILQGAVVFSEQASSDRVDRLVIGQCMRKDAKELWSLSLYIAAAVQLVPIIFSHLHSSGSGAGDGDISMSDGPGSDSSSSSLGVHLPEHICAQIASVIQLYARLHKQVVAWGLDGCWGWKPLLDGKALAQSLGVAGPALGVAMERQAEWRLLNPNGTPEECLAWLNANMGKKA